MKRSVIGLMIVIDPMEIPPTMCHLFDSVEYPLEIWINIDEDIGMQKEYMSYLERK